MELIDIENSQTNSNIISNNLTRVVNFPSQISDCDTCSPVLLDLFISSDFHSIGKFPSFQWLSFQLERWYPFSCWRYLTGKVYVIIWEMIPQEDIFKLGASVAGTELCEWVQVRIDVYIPHRKYRIKSYSSASFSAASTAAIAHRNNFFCLHRQNKSSASKVKLRQATDPCKRVLKLPNLFMLVEQKRSSLPKTLTPATR